MKNKKTDLLVNLLYAFAAITILLGAFFRLQHYPYGSILLIGGFFIGTMASYFHINRLKKTIKTHEQKES